MNKEFITYIHGDRNDFYNQLIKNGVEEDLANDLQWFVEEIEIKYKIKNGKLDITSIN